MVKMENGDKIEFGKRELRTAIDIEDNTITFYMSSGHIVTFSPFSSTAYEGAEALPEFLRKKILYADLLKIKANVAALKAITNIPVTELRNVEDEHGNVSEVSVETGEVKQEFPLYEGICEQIKLLESGKFVVRGISSDEELTLTDEEKAYAFTWIKNPKEFQSVQSSEGITWTLDTLNDSKVMEDIKKAWNKKERKVKSAYRKNPCFAINLAEIRSAGNSKGVLE